MTTKLGTAVRKGRRAAKAVLEQAERRFFARQGRKAVRAKVRRAGRVARKATVSGLAVGAVTALLVVRHEARRHREG
jgi:hypothetical protein